MEPTTDHTPDPGTPPVAPTGRREQRASGVALVFDRAFDASVADVWAAVTEPALLERWIGTWSGEPASGVVAFRMTAEGDDVGEEVTTIVDCVPRERLALEIGVDGAAGGPWRLELTLDARGSGVGGGTDAGTGTGAGIGIDIGSDTEVGTVLTFAQLVDDPSGIGDIAPGWEYYLDRLAAVLRGTAVDAIRFDDYHPGQSDHYRAMFA